MAKSLVLLTVLLSVLVGLMSSPVAAQDNPKRVIINYTTVNESSEGQQLDLFFTVFDTQGQAVLNPEIENINIVLDNGSPVEVLGTSTPDLPFYITLVLDVSGSMGQASTLMQTAANTAINNAPPNTQFAVIQFSHEINLLQSFTPDRNAVAQAISQANSIRGGGTCLYDAIYTGLEQLNTAPDPSRRAVIVFTDGRDEMTQGKGDICSQHPSSEVIDLALSSPQQIPIYTIGLRGAVAINEQELRNFSEATGAISAIGDQTSLTELFQQIINSLRGQRLVEARLCSDSGARTATLIVDAGQALEPDVTQFELETACSLPTATPLPTPTILPTDTATPRPLQIFIESFAVNTQDELITFEVRRAGDIPAVQLRVQIADGETGAVQEQQMIRIGDQSVDVIQFPITNNLRGNIEIIVSALDADGNVIIRQAEEFGVVRPTATPTLRPASIFIESFSVNMSDEVMSFELRHEGDGAIKQYRVLVNDRRSGILQIERLVDVEETLTQTVEISTADLAGGDITIVVNALDADGSVIARQTGEFAVLRPTATPTATLMPMSMQIESVEFNADEKTLILNFITRGTERAEDFRLTIIDKGTNLLQGTYSPDLAGRIELPLPSLEPGQYTVRASLESDSGERVDATSEFQYVVVVTPTPVVVAGIRTIDLDSPNNEFIVRIDPENEGPIKAYRLRVVDSKTGLLVNEMTTFDVPPYDELRFSNASLVAGTYEITVIALDAEDQTITSSSVEIDWTPPPPPTPTPEPGFVERASVTLRENPPLAVGVVLVVLALLAILFVLLRGRGRQQQSWGTALPAPDQTGVFSVPKPPKASQGQQQDDDRTQILSAVPLGAPSATVFIAKAAANTGLQGQHVNLTLPFSIGRSGSSLNFVNDKSVSRNHALITYEGSQYYVQDQGSGNGTFLDDRQLTLNEKAPLRDGSVIRLGPTSELRFELNNDSTQVLYSKK